MQRDPATRQPPGSPGPREAPTRVRDVVVVGSGHNGLVAACYLARAGLDVEVVERDTVIGGAVSTVERFPGFRMDRGSGAHLMIRQTGICEDLQLDRHGLEYEDLDPWAFAPFWDGRPGEDGQRAIVFRTDLDATCESIAAVCGERDALAYRRFATDWAARNRPIFELFAQPPTHLNVGRGMLRAVRGARAPAAETVRQFLTPADALLDAHFTDERLKTALAWLAAQSGPPPHEQGTANLLGWNMLLHTFRGGRPRGGSGALTAALASRLRADGGTLRTGDAVTKITRSGERVTGVLTAGGEHLRARAVLAGCHVLTTAELLGDERLLARVRAGVRVGNGVGMVVRLATTGLPVYPAAAGLDGAEHRALQLLVRSREQLRAAHADFTAGRPPREPAALAMAFSAFDHTVSAPGRHAVTVWGQWHPYKMSGRRRWEAIAEREGTKLAAAVDALAPGFADTIERMHVQTPPDLERELGLRNGNVMHVEMGLDGMFGLRPLPELAGYRTPFPGLYLTGASTHPGGGVFGASGRSAAAVILADQATAPAARLRRRLRRAADLGGFPVRGAQRDMRPTSRVRHTPPG